MIQFDFLFFKGIGITHSWFWVVGLGFLNTEPHQGMTGAIWQTLPGVGQITSKTAPSCL